MNGTSPLTQTEDKIELVTPKPFQQLTGVCIVCDFLLAFFSYSMYTVNERITSELVALWIVAFIITFLAFGFKSKFVFYIAQEEIFIEGTKFFIPYKRLFCDFTDINIIGVECYEERTKQGGKYYSYDLVFALKQQPLVFRRFATTMMVNYVFKFEDINKLGDLLSKTMGCRFKKGELKRSIIASQSKDSSVVYTMGGVITTKKNRGFIISPL